MANHSFILLLGDWPAAAYLLVGRDDLSFQLTAPLHLHHYMHGQHVASSISPSPSVDGDKQLDNEAEVLENDISRLRFGKDQRLKIVMDMLRYRYLTPLDVYSLSDFFLFANAM